MSHIKTLASSKALKIPKKEKVWTVKAAPGPHEADWAIPVSVLLRDYLKLAENRKEVRKILQTKALLLDGKVVTEEKLGVGLLDIVTIPSIDKYYMIMVDNNARLYPQEIDKKKVDSKLCKIVNKTMLKGGKLQLNLYDGKNIVVSAKDAKKYVVGGTLELSLPDLKITGFMERAVGKAALVAKGRHASNVGTITEITKSALNLQSMTTVDVGGEKLMTNTEYIFIVGDKDSKI
jgi:small subunit ribosomal protein S4e